MKTVLVTGAAGGIGTRLRKLMKGRYPDIRWSDLKTPPDLAPDETFVQADLSVMNEVERIVAGRAGHRPSWRVLGRGALGDDPQRQYHRLLQPVRGRAPRQVERDRVRVVEPRGRLLPAPTQIGIDSPVRPDSRYGVSKAFGEALGALYAYKHGLRVTCLRIGNVTDTPADKRRLSIWISPEDLLQLIRIGLEHPDIRHEIFFGASDNARSFWDNEPAFRYGYRPKGRAEDHAAAALAADAKLPPDPVGDWYQGGPYCSDEFDDGIVKSPI